MNKDPSRIRNVAATAALSMMALTGCAVTTDTYAMDDPANVRCDGNITEVDVPLIGSWLTKFIVHGIQRGDVAVVTVRRNSEGVSVKTTGDVTGPPQQRAADGFTPPTPVVDGYELNAFGAGGAWIIDVKQDAVDIQGSCAGM